MIGWLIIACEIGFWLFVAAGIVVRYLFGKKKASMILLICTPVTDLVLLLATVVDLRNGAVASTMHGLAAVYMERNMPGMSALAGITTFLPG